MNNFYRLISLYISTTGFVVVAALLLARGDSLLTSAVNSVLATAALWVGLSVLQTVLALAANSKHASSETEEADSDTLIVEAS